MRNDACRRRGGFTLTELLVVIGVIALLIGILLPTLSKAREASRRTACLSNIRSIGQGLVAYANTFKDKLPNGNPWGGRWDDFNGANRVMVYFANEFIRGRGTGSDIYKTWKGAEVFWCPSDIDAPPRRIITAEHTIQTIAPVAEDSARTSYEFFSLWFPAENPARLSRMRGGQAPLAWDQDGGQPINPVTNQPMIVNDSPLRNHKGGGNVLHADGSAAWQHERLWDHVSWPSPASRFYPVP